MQTPIIQTQEADEGLAQGEAMLDQWRTVRQSFYQQKMDDATREYCVALEKKIFAMSDSDYYSVSRILSAYARIKERTGSDDYHAALMLADSAFQTVANALFAAERTLEGPDNRPQRHAPRERESLRAPHRTDNQF
ncbi:hypothetical protein GALL_152140 [mine drainage metagenome]|uniref:Uncharacterized protein n=1 Tax=mine drainage metagenome TaxID=410659 RepID=A0A1J5SFE1_9ZZZZ